MGNRCGYIAIQGAHEQQGQQKDVMNRLHHRLRTCLSVIVLPSGQLLGVNPCVWVVFKVAFFCKMSREKFTCDRQPCRSLRMEAVFSGKQGCLPRVRPAILRSGHS
jgi:hypothetical protein